MKQPKEGVTIRRRRGSVEEQEIFSAIRQFDEAGNITVKEFAAAYQISEATYYNWRKKYQAKEQAIAPAGFTEVDLSGLGEQQGKGAIFAEFRGIIFYQRVDAAYLKALL
jgi:transposase-like protein